MTTRVRFAPSPTGSIHVGNIRVAIFNWLFARNTKGKFLLRIEDTDSQRNTPKAIQTLFDCMQWLNLDYDDEVFYQSFQKTNHLDVAKNWINEKKTYKMQKGEGAEVTVFRIPLDEDIPFVEKVGKITHKLHNDAKVVIKSSGVEFSLISKKGKAIPQESCLAGLKDMKLYDRDNKLVFNMEENIQKVLQQEEFSFDNISKMTFTRRVVKFNDLIKGELSKPIDTMKDLIILKSNGDPIFHLANVIDDSTQNITHIIRGDDHIENTYRHIFMFYALGKKAPLYAHLPMIVNQQGKPYSKRDGDAFVSDFKEAGYLPEALFNFLTLLGWSPNEKEEIVSRKKMVKLFDISKVKSTPAQMNLKKLFNFNSVYLEQRSFEQFINLIKPFILKKNWLENEDYFLQVAKLMQSRTKTLKDVQIWQYFFTNDYKVLADEKRWDKTFSPDYIVESFYKLIENFTSLDDFVPNKIQLTIEQTTQSLNLGNGKLNLPLRLATTGAGGGAELFDTLALIGKDNVIFRLNRTIKNKLEY